MASPITFTFVALCCVGCSAVHQPPSSACDGNDVHVGAPADVLRAVLSANGDPDPHLRQLITFVKKNGVRVPTATGCMVFLRLPAATDAWGSWNLVVHSRFGQGRAASDDICLSLRACWSNKPTATSKPQPSLEQAAEAWQEARGLNRFAGMRKLLLDGGLRPGMTVREVAKVLFPGPLFTEDYDDPDSASLVGSISLDCDGERPIRVLLIFDNYNKSDIAGNLATVQIRSGVGNWGD